MATCRQSPYLHKPAMPALQTYGHLTAFHI